MCLGHVIVTGIREGDIKRAFTNPKDALLNYNKKRDKSNRNNKKTVPKNVNSSTKAHSAIHVYVL